MRSRSCLLWRAIAALFCAAFVCVLSMEAVAATENARASVSADTLKAKIEEAEATTSLDPEMRTRLIELYRKALSDLEKVDSDKTAAEGFRGSMDSASREAEALRKKLKRQGQRDVTLGVSETAPLPEIEQVLLKEQANLAAVEAKLAGLEEQLATEAARPSAVRKRLTEARQLQDEAARKVRLPPAAGESAALSEARRWRAETRALALSTEIRMLDQELLSQPVRVDLLRVRRDEAVNSVERIGSRVNRLEDLVVERRRAEAESAIDSTEAAKRDMVGKHPLLQDLAERNAALSEVIAGLTTNLERVTAGKDRISAEAKRIEENFRRTSQKVEVAGLSEALGMVLYEQRRSLPGAQALRQQTRASEKEIAVARLRRLQNQEELTHLRDIAEYVAALAAHLPAEEAEQVREEIVDLARKREVLLERAVELDETYFLALGDLEFSQRQFLDAVRNYDDYLAGRLLWIRTSRLLGVAELRAIPADVALLVSPANWLAVSKIIVDRVLQSPAFLVSLVLFVVLLWKRPSLRGGFPATSQFVGRPTTDSFVFTLQALVLSLLVAAPWPLLLATFGWVLRKAPEATVLSNAVSIALLRMTAPLFLLQAFRVLCDRGGLAATHFSWAEPTRRSLRREIGRLMAGFLPAAFVFVVLINHEQVGLKGGLERLLLVVATISLAGFFYGLLEPERGVLRPVLASDPTSVVYRFRRLWLAVILTVPAVLVGLTVYGYVYAAGTYLSCLARTVWLVLTLVFVHQMVVRWLTISRHRLKYQAALERHEAARAAAEQAREGGEAGGDDVPPAVEEPEVDLATLSEEVQKLLNSALIVGLAVGLWYIWRTILPGLEILGEITLWHRTATVGGEVQHLPVTLFDAGLAVLIAAGTVALARHFPALLRIVLYQRLGMKTGDVYTATTLSRYFIVGTGSLLAISTIGFSWSRIQWLVAALGVGVGFGLQEIVANFISGLILLFERPIRVGDVVTVADTDGIVTRIRIRATTIRNWDGQELLVPNKEFVTGRLLNWTLSDPLTRITVPVGVAYGSDVQRAMSLMLNAAKENERVLDDPAPNVIFVSFGDNALSLVLRAYLDSLEHRVFTISELHEAINRKFNEAGIVIAFPQRDVHLDTSRPLDVRIRKDGGD